ncbi:28S ribosomal protein S31, mitochondrial isoform X3 [Belonocnema kinseyi]|uniref:28S ribosomal protein S31, mitochondrial isoform X3 n=1 Tax=Belonocnema kinseyi TaxID=2817044 RepID=UPI00143CF813|nr:28S ribosomal protein S31, mitochondrial isoform X3 [Belonocnema kinseyi]
MLTNRMLSLQTISRSITPYSGAARHQLHTSIKFLSASTSDSSDSSGSDSDKESKKSKPKKESVEDLKKQNRRDGLNTLNTLITELSKKTASSKIDVAIPKKKPRPPPEKDPQATEESRFEAKLTSAAKTLAEKIGGDVKKTEIDLLDRLLKKKVTSDVDGKPEAEAAPESSLDQSDILKGFKIVRNRGYDREADIQNRRVDRIRQTNRKVDNFQVQVKDERSTLRDLLQQQKRNENQPSYDEKSVMVGRQASRTIRRELQNEKTRAEFSSQDIQPSADEGFSEAERQASRSVLRELYESKKSAEFSQKESKLDDEKSRNFDGQTSRSRFSQREFKSPQDESISSERPKSSKSTLWELYRKQQRGQGPDGYSDSRSYTFRFHGRSYGIFEAEQSADPKVADLSTWAELENKELKSLLFHPPQNYFQEMIQWTEQGKVWCFPIDNEQGMEEEQNVHFSEHVFLERHLKGWCPKKGPIRHFMELVCVGLSKNPYMTVEEKTDHIMWYKDYFGDKRDLLVDLGAIANEDPSILPKPTNKIDLGPHV